jgi:hypothetical protein
MQNGEQPNGDCQSQDEVQPMHSSIPFQNRLAAVKAHLTTNFAGWDYW